MPTNKSQEQVPVIPHREPFWSQTVSHLAQMNRAVLMAVLALIMVLGIFVLWFATSHDTINQRGTNVIIAVPQSSVYPASDTPN